MKQLRRLLYEGVLGALLYSAGDMTALPFPMSPRYRLRVLVEGFFVGIGTYYAVRVWERFTEWAVSE